MRYAGISLVLGFATSSVALVAVLAPGCNVGETPAYCIKNDACSNPGPGSGSGTGGGAGVGGSTGSGGDAGSDASDGTGGQTVFDAGPTLEKQFGAFASVQQPPPSLFVNAKGELVLAGGFQGPLTFGGAPTLKAADPSTYVVELGSSLAFKWDEQLPATCLASAIDPSSGDVVIAGAYVNVIPDGGTPDGGTGGGSTVDAGSGVDLGCGELSSTQNFFVARFAAATGACSFTTTFSATLAQAALAVDGKGNTLLAGGVTGNIDFGQSSPPPASGQDVFVVKFDKSGKLVSPWPIAFVPASASTPAAATAVATDGDDNVFITGTFSGMLDFGTGGPPLETTGVNNVFVAAFGSGGSTLWATSFASPGAQNPGGDRRGRCGPTARW